MPEYKLQIGKFPVEVFLCNDENWLHDTVFIYNAKKGITNREINTILQYLYDEGYVKDRRTKYEIFDDNLDND